MLPISPVVLAGRVVRLEPLSPAHIDDLTEAAGDHEIWPYMPVTLRTRTEVAEWVDRSLATVERGIEFPFAIVEQASRLAIGSTRLMDIRPEHRGVEIGYSWQARPWWRTAANTEAKYLLLGHCFETLDCIRVALKTDRRNERSQRAIERLGAVREGVLRHHQIAQHGYRRDTVYYSILAEEWPAVKERLEGFLRRTGVDSAPF